MKPLRIAATVSLSVLCLAASTGCRKPAATTVPEEEAQKLLLDRNWIDRLPQTPHERLHVFRFVPSMGGGVYQDRTLFAGHFYDPDGDVPASGAAAMYNAVLYCTGAGVPGGGGVGNTFQNGAIDANGGTFTFELCNAASASAKGVSLRDGVGNSSNSACLQTF